MEGRWNIRSLGNHISTWAGIPARPSPAFFNPPRSRVENHFSYPILAQEGCATYPKPRDHIGPRTLKGLPLLEHGAHGISNLPPSAPTASGTPHPPPEDWWWGCH